jgi:hypothetical protein
MNEITTKSLYLLPHSLSFCFLLIIVCVCVCVCVQESKCVIKIIGYCINQVQLAIAAPTKSTQSLDIHIKLNHGIT